MKWLLYCVQALAREKISELGDSLDDSHRMLRNAESQINKSTAGLQEADLQLQASREEARDLGDRLDVALSRLHDAETLATGLQVQACLENARRFVGHIVLRYNCCSLLKNFPGEGYNYAAFSHARIVSVLVQASS